MVVITSILNGRNDADEAERRKVRSVRAPTDLAERHPLAWSKGSRDVSG
jgi:hypothetical protein